MRKILLIAITLLFAISCRKDENNGLNEHTVFVNVSYKYGNSPDFKPKTANNSIVFIFADEGKQIDNEKTSLLYDKRLTFTDGTHSKIFLFSSNNKTGINIFENVPNGNYIFAAIHKPYEFIQYYSIKKVSIANTDLEILSHNITFDIDKGQGFQIWNKE